MYVHTGIRVTSYLYTRGCVSTLMHTYILKSTFVSEYIEPEGSALYCVCVRIKKGKKEIIHIILNFKKLMDEGSYSSVGTYLHEVCAFQLQFQHCAFQIKF